MNFWTVNFFTYIFYLFSSLRESTPHLKFDLLGEERKKYLAQAPNYSKILEEVDVIMKREEFLNKRHKQMKESAKQTIESLTAIIKNKVEKIVDETIFS